MTRDHRVAPPGAHQASCDPGRVASYQKGWRMAARFSFFGRIAALWSIVAVVATAGCINIFWKTDIRAVERPSPSQTTDRITSPVKVHLADGSTVIFRTGASVSHDRITGSGVSWALLSAISTQRAEIPMDSVVGVETFEGKSLGGASVLVSLAATVAGFFGTAALAVAIFGSCPTVYADSGTGPVLQAEGFSYAIAPLLEHRDVDRLRVRPGADGIVRLELRNEALETHFLNHIELLEVRHPTGSRVVPDQSGHLLALSGFTPVARATDRAGRDVRDRLAASDGQLFGSAPSVVRAAREGDLDDWIDLDVSGLPPGDSVAVVLRLRNSLLNTVLLYDGMLSGRDAPDWLNSGLQHIASAVDLSRWYVRTMGMRASVEGVALTGDPRLGVARLGDVGPIAFRDVALVLPRAAADAKVARVRLRFVADNWRIDELLVAGTIVRPAWTALPVDTVVVPTPADGKGPVLDTAAVRMVADADDRYLETRPGQRMTLVFHPASARPLGGDSSATYLIAWQGWYREWIRGSWLANPKRTTPFVPGDAAVLAALRSWSERKTTLEREFYASRIPVR